MKKEKEKNLQQEIENLRKKMVETANKKGFTSSETIELSQKLDLLLNENLKRTKNR